MTPLTGTPSPDVRALDLDSLRAHRQVLSDEEQLISYWRRVVQGRLDLLHLASDEEEHVTVPDLVDALGAPSAVERRPALLWTLPQPMEVIPGIGDLWMQPLHPHDAAEVAQMRRTLAAAEAELSARRQALFTRLDSATAELVRRYAFEPAAALDLLPDV